MVTSSLCGNLTIAQIWQVHEHFSTKFYHENFVYSGLVLHVIVENKWTPSWILLDALKYKVFPYIFSMVICTYSVHITMGNILPNFETKNDLGTAQLLQNMLRNYLKHWVKPAKCFIEQYFTLNLFRGYIVAMRQSNHRTNLASTPTLFQEILSWKFCRTVTKLFMSL